MAKVSRREFLLVIDGEESTRRLLTARLRNEGYVCQATGNGVEAMELVLNQDVAGVLLDINLPHELGFRLLKEITSGSPDTAVIIVTDVKNTDAAIRFVRQGGLRLCHQAIQPGRRDPDCQTGAGAKAPGA